MAEAFNPVDEWSPLLKLGARERSKSDQATRFMSTDPGLRFRVGTCGYSYPGAPPEGWHGIFYPSAAPRRFDTLEFYAAYFDLVEINTTFYRPASRAMVSAWAAKTPPGFQFSVKLWQKFTHPSKLGEVPGEAKERWAPLAAADSESFAESIAPLADAGKLCALLLQYPASFHHNDENRMRLQATLQAFAHYPKVVELRHSSWSEPASEAQELLDRHKTAWAYIDEPKFPSSVRQELKARGDIAYLRLHGRNREKWWKHQNAWERYDYYYPRESVRRLAQRLQQLAARSPRTKFYVLFNNHARGQAVANALMLKAELNPAAPKRAPATLIEAFPELNDFYSEREGAALEPRSSSGRGGLIGLFKGGS